MTSPSGNVARARATATMTGLRSTPRGQATLRVDSVTAGGLSFASLSATARSDDGHRWEVALATADADQLGGGALGAVSVRGDTVAVDLDSLAVRYPGVDVHLTRPTRFRRAGDGTIALDTMGLPRGARRAGETLGRLPRYRIDCRRARRRRRPAADSRPWRPARFAPRPDQCDGTPRGNRARTAGNGPTARPSAPARLECTSTASLPMSRTPRTGCVSASRRAKAPEVFWQRERTDRCDYRCRPRRRSCSMSRSPGPWRSTASTFPISRGSYRAFT